MYLGEMLRHVASRLASPDTDVENATDVASSDT